MADRGSEKGRKKAIEDFSEGMRVGVYSNDPLASNAIDMSFEELFVDGVEAEYAVGGVDLYDPEGNKIGRYNRVNYRPNAQPSASEGEHGALIGRLEHRAKDLTQFADQQALKNLYEIANFLGQQTT